MGVTEVILLILLTLLFVWSMARMHNERQDRKRIAYAIYSRSMGNWMTLYKCPHCSVLFTLPTAAEVECVRCTGLVPIRLPRG